MLLLEKSKRQNKLVKGQDSFLKFVGRRRWGNDRTTSPSRLCFYMNLVGVKHTRLNAVTVECPIILLFRALMLLLWPLIAMHDSWTSVASLPNFVSGVVTMMGIE